MNPVTLYSWGYWGWGNSTRELKKAVNAAERVRGFAPPFFVDIRYRRSGRAPEFVGDYFKNILGESNYHWEPRLGNANIGGGREITQEDRQRAAVQLLDRALRYARRKQRVLLFCACVFPQWHRYPDDYGKLPCHRDGVAELICEIASERGTDIEVVEWPGLERDAEIDLKVAADLFNKLKCGRKTVPLSAEHVDQHGLGYFACLPWGTIATIRCGGESLAAMTGPVRFKGSTAFLPVLGRAESAEQLQEAVVQFRQDAGLNSRRTNRRKRRE